MAFIALDVVFIIFTIGFWIRRDGFATRVIKYYNGRPPQIGGGWQFRPDRDQAKVFTYVWIILQAAVGIWMIWMGIVER